MNEDRTPISIDSSPSADTGQTLPPKTHPVPPPIKESRSDLVLILGILSLFMCGPLGIIAWIIANSDLKKIRIGTVSSRKVGLLKVGRALGIVGAILFVAAIFATTFVLQGRLGSLTDVITSEPLKTGEFMYVGEWHGNRGTYIRINPDGRGDFQSRHSRVRGGAVKISGNKLTIGMLGISMSWHVDRPPCSENGDWTMQLDGEVFKRKGDDVLVVLAPKFLSL